LYQELGYTDEDVKCPVAAELANRVISLPVHPALTEDDLKYIVENINNFGEVG
jgi:perosamine synthetase